MKKRLCAVLLILCMLPLVWGCQTKPEPTESSLADSSLASDQASSASDAPSPSPTLEASLEPSPTPEQELSERERLWIADINYLRDQYKRTHVDPFYYCSEEEFNWRLDQVAAKVSELSDSDIFYELQAVWAGMGDIHTSLEMPESIYEYSLPITIECLGESFCAVGYLDGYEQLEPYLLREIVGVNGIDIAYLRKKGESISAPRNVWFSKYSFPAFLMFPTFLDWAGCGYRDGYTFQILDENRQVVDVEVPVIDNSQAWESEWKFHESWHMLDTCCWDNRTQYLEYDNGGIVYLCVSDMHNWASKESYVKLFEETAQLLDEHPNSKLVIDLRTNSGGNSLIHDYVREALPLLDTEKIKQTYVLISGRVASAAMALIPMFCDGLDGITVGEPIAQSIHERFGHSSSAELVLPHSQITVWVSNLWFTGEQDTDEPILTEDGKLYLWENTLMPDAYVPMDIEDIRAGKDSVIQWVLEH